MKNRTIAAGILGFAVLGGLAAWAATTPEAAPAAPSGEPGAGAIQTPSWFEGGEGLYVPPYYDTFPGLDTTALSAQQKERFLHWVNTEFCACGQTGCRRDTIANCYINDKSCPNAPVRIRKIFDLVRQGQRPQGASAPPKTSAEAPPKTPAPAPSKLPAEAPSKTPAPAPSQPAPPAR